MAKDNEEEIEAKSCLIEIALATGKDILESIRYSRLQRERKEYIVREATLFAPSGLTFSTGKTTRDVWDAYEVNRIIEVIKERFSEEFERCAMKLSSIGGKEISTVRGDLGLFLLAVAKRTADELSVASLEEMVEQLTYEMSGGALNWTGQIWLRGIQVAEGPIQIGSSLKLRQPASSDFSSEYPAEAIGGIGFGFPVIPDSILEFSSSSRDRPDLRKEINALSLFRLGAVEMLSEDWRSNSLLPYNNICQSTLHTGLYTTAYSYEVSESHAPALAAFMEKVAGKLPISLQVIIRTHDGAASRIIFARSMTPIFTNASDTR